MARKKKCPEFENHERWLVAFADMMTLLFALFVVLYAIAVVNSSKVKQVTFSLEKYNKCAAHSLCTKQGKWNKGRKGRENQRFTDAKLTFFGPAGLQEAA